MLTSSLRQRLSRVARGMGPATSTPTPTRQESLPPSVPAAPPAPATRPFLLAYCPEASGRLEEAASGPFWRVEPPLADLLPDWAERAAELEGVGPTLFVDIETAGLAGAPLFLIGVLRVGPEGVWLAQFLARDYAEEAAVVQAFGTLGAEWERWVTFNGAVFDVPYIQDRAIMHRARVLPPAEHVDLLPRSRKRWRGEFSDCRLQTLETHVCGLRRVGDVPGAAIPALYHQFVRRSHWDLIAPVLHHNAMDLLTMAQLWRALA